MFAYWCVWQLLLSLGLIGIIVCMGYSIGIILLVDSGMKWDYCFFCNSTVDLCRGTFLFELVWILWWVEVFVGSVVYCWWYSVAKLLLLCLVVYGNSVAICFFSFYCLLIMLGREGTFIFGIVSLLKEDYLFIGLGCDRNLENIIICVVYSNGICFLVDSGM